ncbi:MAG: mechanosensitive ion channel family protein [Nitrospiraceae bacterium]|nr:mechanosensitive ion channel family protein [Nitrospiraceae bacterium]
MKINVSLQAQAERILQYRFWQNRIQDYLTSLAIILAGVFLVKIFKRIVLYRLKAWAEKTETRIDDLVVAGIEKAVLPIVYLGIFYLAVTYLAISAPARKFTDIAGAALLTLFAIRFSIAALKHSTDLYWRRDEDAVKRQIFNKLFPIIQVIAWSIGVIFLLDNLGFKISSLVAGLGLSGVAIALASQAVLKDVFGYFIILFDRPFEMNDFIVISGSDLMGTIEHVGIRTTRLRSLSGELLVFSNSDLTSSRIKNYKTLRDRRIQFNIGVTYETSLQSLKEIPGIIESIIKGAGNVSFERAHFFSFDASSLTFQVVYHVLSDDYKLYMDIQQKINLGIAGEFERRGIEFSYPTQVVYLKKGAE